MPDKKSEPKRSERPDTTDSTPITPSLVREEPADQPMGEPGMNDEERLDEALKETLPTSDPISIHIE